MNEEELIRIIAYSIHVSEWGYDYDDQVSYFYECLDLNIEVKGWSSTKNIRDSWKSVWEAEIHDGDCTKQIHSCMLCIKERYIEGAKRILKELKSYE